MDGYAPRTDLNALSLMVKSLKTFIYEDEIYGSIGFVGPILSIGSILFYIHRFDGMNDSLARVDQRLFSDCKTSFLATCSESKLHYLDKVSREIQSRLRQLEQYVQDIAYDGSMMVDNYRPEAMRRTVLLHLVEQQMIPKRTDSLLEEHMQLVDRQLRGLLPTEPQEFLWNRALQPLYPPEVYWWLYGLPQFAGRA
jgi:hypothetical protein